MNGERVCETREPIVFVVDQPPFKISKSPSDRALRFCILRPLTTLSGEHLATDAESFPNRARVWWMLLDTIPERIVVPGSLWTGTIEPAVKWESYKPDSDRFQAQVRNIHPGGRELVEVLQVSEDDPDPAWVQRPELFPWPRPTTALVMLLGKRSVLGPLRADWDAEKEGLRLSAREPARPEMLSVPIKDFVDIARIEYFTGNLQELDHLSEPKPFKVTLSRLPWLHLDQLRQAATVLDASTDAQVLTWAVRQQVLASARADQIKEVAAAVASGAVPIGDESATRKLARLRQLATNTARALELGEEGARTLAQAPAFAELVREHTAVLAGQSVKEEVERRRGEIEAEVSTQQQRLEQVRKELDQLDAEYAGRREVMEEELRKQMATRLRSLEERERGLADQEKHLLQRLERVCEHYSKEADRVGDQLLAQLPLLRKLGLANGAEGVSHHVAPATLSLPEFLDTPQTTPGAAPPSESEFVDQLAHVAAARGFFFTRDDLINFHVCVKTGGLTILAGLSGTGKSSLPRLYAEALGCKPEYLHVAVRPDWLDDRDLMGAFNAVAQRYEPAASGLVDRLIAAEHDRRRDRGGLYLVCLDEMNLARVEHYFAQFLSILELPPADRFLELFAPGLVHADDPYHPYQRLPLGDNVRFVGTVNIDETTHFFSPKVLDRAQVVVFGPPDLSARRSNGEAGPIRSTRPVPLDAFRSWCRKGNPSSPAGALLISLAEVLNRARLGLGYRPFHRVLDYVASAAPLLTEDQALDRQLLQVVFPRLRPTAPGFADVLRELRTLLSPDRFPRAAEHLARLEAQPDDEFFQVV